MSKKIIIANWKMNPASQVEVLQLAKNFQFSISNFQKIQLVICPSFIHIPVLEKYLKTRSSKLKASLGAQDVFWEREGAYTGEISPGMLKEFGVKHIIVGHSERRALGETDEMVGKKVRACLKENLIPILCVGERVRDHEMFYFSAVKKQLIEGLKFASKKDLKKIIIAYEPVWAIGKASEREATPAESLEMVIFIKKVLVDKFGLKSIQDLKIVYGGSVNPKNASKFLTNGGVDGLLIGRDSLDPEKFKAIVDS